jgi:hypothetical protein
VVEGCAGLVVCVEGVIVTTSEMAAAPTRPDHRQRVAGGPRHLPRLRQTLGPITLSRLVAVVVPAPPPEPEPARVVPEREVGVEHDPVHTVVAAGQQIAVPLTEVIGHPRTVRSPASLTQLPRRGHLFWRSPGTSVGSLPSRTRVNSDDSWAGQSANTSSFAGSEPEGGD